jgi:adenylosuccinate synthase
MSSLLLIGMQWGDEGKGKIVDAFAGTAQVIMRYQGGANSGHTLKIKDETIVLHHLPSGVFHEPVLNIMGWGMVVSPDILLEEIATVERLTGQKLTPKQLLISPHTSLVLPAHRRLEARRESEKKIGTTKRGIGPAYEDRIGRNAVRLADILDKEGTQLREVVENLYLGHGHVASSFEKELKAEMTQTVELCQMFAERMGPHVAPVSQIIRKAYDENKKVLFEGAQGAMLDIQQGTYPYVTSSMTGLSGVFASLGIYTPVDRCVGISKAYCTRVGEGPFPSELNDKIGEKIQTDGNEFGATTGRKRRVGWLDLVQLRYAARANNLSEIILTKADVLQGYETVKLVTAYNLNGKKVTNLEGGYEMTSDMTVELEEMPGWASVNDKQGNLTKTLESFCKRIEEFTGAIISAISYGPGREEIVFRGKKSFSDFYQ